MKAFLILLFIFLSHSAWSVCNAPLSRTNFSAGSPPTNTKYNSDFNNFYTHINSLSGDCFSDSTLQTEAFADEVATTEKLASASVTASKFAASVVPPFNRPVRIIAFTTSGAWLKRTDTGNVFVQVIGGGGAGGGTASINDSFYYGGTSSFGAHCSATGGKGQGAGQLGAAGTGSSGNINLSGAAGTTYIDQPYGNPAKGGISMIGKYGKGGSGVRLVGSGGAGGYCAKFILASALADSVSVTVGTGGTWAGSYGSNGESGLVLVYEYEKDQ